MSVHRAAPSAALRPHVHSIVVVASAAGDTRVVLPEPGLVLGFRIGGAGASIEAGRATSFSTSALSGLRTTLRRMLTPTAGVTVVASFRPLAAARFFRTPLHELFGEVVPLAELVPRAMLREAEEKMAEAPDAAAQARVLDAFLARLQREERDDDALVRAAVEGIVRAHGNVRIEALARALGTSQDPLEKRFRRLVGASPKQFASIVRFRRAVAASATGKSLAEVAHATGYFDQSHLARTFRAFTGAPPSRFLGRVPFCATELDQHGRHGAVERASG